MSPPTSSFWEQPEQVEKFAGREPDHRLRALLQRWDDPESVAVLDLGCAGGRNTGLLVREGFDVRALDASSAMVEATRRRVAGALGPEEARRRVREGRMADLSAFPDGAFRLVVALGVYHNARSREGWDAALAETARVLEPGGLVLVSNFAPGTDLTGEGMQPVAGAEHVYRGSPGGPMFLLPADALDEEMARHGLRPVEPTGTVEVKADPGRRVTVNGLYRKAPADAS